MEFTVEAPGLKEVTSRIRKIGGPELAKDWFRARKGQAKRLEDLQRDQAKGRSRMAAKVARSMKAFTRGDAVGTKFQPYQHVPFGGGVYFGAKQYRQFPAYKGVPGYVFDPPAQEFGAELARDTNEFLQGWVAENVAR